MKPSRSLIAGVILSIAVAMLFMLSAAAPAMSSGGQANPAVATAGGIQPYATLDSNVTWSEFHSGWKTLEYSNGTANLTLNAELSPFYKNPISVNPADIIAPGYLQGDHLGSFAIWQDASLWGWAGGNTATNQTRSVSNATVNGETVIQEKDAVSGNVPVSPYASICIPRNDYLSQNIEYDYLTVIAGFNAPSNSASAAIVNVANQTGASNMQIKVAPGSVGYISVPLSQTKVNLNTTAGKGYSNELQVQTVVALPSKGTVTGTYTVTIYGMAFTTYAFSLGENSTGATVSKSSGNALLSSLNPSFKWKDITDGGYTVAISQPLQNLTTQQNAISSGNYIEQVEYQGSFKLPSAPDLSYGPAQLTEQFNISTSQVTVLDINGVSYLTTISGKNGTITLSSAVNPTSTTTYLEIVHYTSTQWDAVSGPPGFFSVQGIEYYFDEIVLGIMALVGLGGGAAAIHIKNLRKVR